MSRNKSSDNKTMVVKDFAVPLANYYKRKYTPFVINSEGGFYKFGNELIPQWLFDIAHPIEMLKNRVLQDDSLDGRAIQ